MKFLAVTLTLCAQSALVISQDLPLNRLPLLTFVIGHEASWSSDGREIVLISNRHGGMRVHILDASSTANGSNMRQITNAAGEFTNPLRSPDGKKTLPGGRFGGTTLVLFNAPN